MAIIIPSKNIYGKQNKIVADNIINKINFNNNSDNLYIEANKTVGETTYTTDVYTIPASNIKQSIDTNLYNDEGTYRYGTVQLFIEKYSTLKTITIPKKFGETSVVSSLNHSLNTTDRLVDISITYEKTTGRAKRNFIKQSYGTTGDFTEIEYIEIENKIVVSSTEITPKNDFAYPTYTISNSSKPFSGGQPITASIDVSNPTFLNGQEYKDNGDSYSIYVVIYSGFKLTEFNSAGFIEGDTITGEYTQYKPISVTIMPKGTITGINFNLEQNAIGDGNNTFSLSDNEIFQTKNKNTDNGKNSIDFLAENVISQYSNGKEMCTLNCAYSDYYTTDSEKAISITDNTLPMTFSIGDIVEPYIKTPNSTEDIPLSVSNNGNPKQFVVTKIRNVDDGLSMQEITIIEK